jgi:ubiquinone/menaquinone biosynthesis C-methylase UbiE
MEVKRIPLLEESISDRSSVAEYDCYAAIYMRPEYKYFVRKIVHQGIRRGRVLDIGTGSGRLAIELAKTKGCNYEIVAVDLSKNMLGRAQKKAIEERVDDKIQFLLSNACKLPFADQSIDLIISYASLHHWRQPVSVFREIQRVVKKSGTIIIRDNRRIFGDKAWETFVWGVSLFMNKSRRDNWRKVILSSYTIPEVKELIKESGFRNYRISTDFVGFDISIQANPS